MSDEAHTGGAGAVANMPELIPIIEVTTASGAPVASMPVVTTESGHRVVEAPIIVVPPGSSGLISEKQSINTGGGSVVKGDVATEKFTGRDETHTQNDLRYNTAGSSVTFLNPDNAALWQANMKLLQDIANVAERLDNVPDRLKELEKFLHTPSIVPSVVPPVIVPVTAKIDMTLQTWLLIIIIFLILLTGGIWISSMIAP